LGRGASQPHSARLVPGRGELVGHQAVCEELERRGATLAVAPFSGRADQGERTGAITLSRLQGDEFVDVELWTGRDELALALEDRCGTDTRASHVSPGSGAPSLGRSLIAAS